MLDVARVKGLDRAFEAHSLDLLSISMDSLIAFMAAALGNEIPNMPL